MDWTMTIYLEDPDLEILYFNVLRRDPSLNEITKDFSSVSDALQNLHFAIKDKTNCKFLVPPQGGGVVLLHEHKPFIFGDGWKGHTGTYQLQYASLYHTGATLDLKQLLETMPRPWFVKIRQVSAPEQTIEGEGGFFDKALPKRLEISRY